jgi:hypothetical protein
MTIHPDVMLDRVKAKMQRLVRDVPVTGTDFDANGQLKKKSVKRVVAVVKSRLTPQDLEVFGNAAVHAMADAMLDARVRLGAGEYIYGGDGSDDERRYRHLRDLTPDEELEVERAMEDAVEQLG